MPQVRHVRVNDGVFVMPKVDSSMMTFVDYDKAARELLILFTSGKAYTYFEVPQKVYRGLMQADSKGRYFLDCIEGQYAYAQARGRRRA
jgi:hypothetical protein